MKLNKNIALSESGFIFNASRGDSFSTNPMGLEIIRALQAGKRENEIKAEILEKYSIDEASLEKDLYDFFNILKHYQLLQD